MTIYLLQLLLLETVQRAPRRVDATWQTHGNLILLVVYRLGLYGILPQRTACCPTTRRRCLGDGRDGKVDGQRAYTVSMLLASALFVSYVQPGDP